MTTTASSTRSPRRLPARPSWPGARPVLGGLLVALAALIALAASSGGSDSTDVVVAVRDLPAGVVLGPEDLALAAIDAPDVVLDRSVTDPAEVVGTTLRVDLAANEVVQRSAVDAVDVDTDRFELALDLAEAQAVGGRLRPGDQVLVVSGGDEPVELGPARVASVAAPVDALGGAGVVVVLGVDDPELARALGTLDDGDVRLIRITPGGDR
ncbi:MAG: SAF domain-containing protein [Actinomycetota bacterium]